jgi:hypothetical protein
LHNRYTLHVNAVVNIGLFYRHSNVYRWKQNHGIQNIDIEGCNGNVIVDNRQVLKMKILEDYITQLYNQPNQPENLEVILEKEVYRDKKGSYILQSYVEKKNCKEIRYKKATGDIFKQLGEDGLGQMTQLINNICDTGERSKDFNKVTVTALKK